MRRGEIIALTWDDIDFNAGTVSITKSTVLVGGTMVTKQPKSRSSRRKVSLPGNILNLLLLLRDRQTEQKIAMGTAWHGEGFVFIQWDGKQMYPSTPTAKMRKMIKRHNEQSDSIGLPQIPLHGLRHTAATLLIAHGIDVETVAHRLGHADTSITLNVYSHALAETDRTASATLNGILSGAL